MTMRRMDVHWVRFNGVYTLMRFIRIQNFLDFLPDLHQVHSQSPHIFEFALCLGFLDK